MIDHEMEFIEPGIMDLITEMDAGSNATNVTGQFAHIPMYIRITVGILVVLIFIVGTIGNTMVAMVISNSREMRSSTNFFLLNLSICDLLVLLVVTPTALLEVVYHPDIWLLGPTMCKIVPMLELLVCNASVLTILAITFERYYAICSPLKVLYLCTKTRAAYICAVVWVVAFIITCPMIFMSHTYEIEVSGVTYTTCVVEAGTFWPDTYTVSNIIIFFLLPFGILLFTFRRIVLKLTMDRSALNAKDEHQQQARSQVVFMLGTVVFVFFLCLLPFRLLTLYVLLSEESLIPTLGPDLGFSLLYFSRVMMYINSASNPLLYNAMSSKFRNGFRRLCGRAPDTIILHRNGTFLTLTTTASAGNMNNNLTRSTSTSPVLTGSFVRKNGTVRKLEGSFYQNGHYNGIRGGRRLMTHEINLGFCHKTGIELGKSESIL